MLPYPVEQRVAEIKKEYPSALVFDIQDLSKRDTLLIVARPLTMAEVAQVLEIANRSAESAEEWLFETAFQTAHSFINDSEVTISELPISVPKQMFNIVMEASSMMELPPFMVELNGFREVHSSVFYEGAKFIMKAFGQYTLKAIKNLTRTEFAELIMLSEKIHESPFEILDPSQAPDEKTEENRMLRKIQKEAETNDNYLDFGADNERLNDAMR